MPTSENTIRVNIVATDRPIWSGAARSVSIPAQQGAMGILPDHEPILSLMKKGVVTVVAPDGKKMDFDIDGGFISFDSNVLTVAANHSDGQKSAV